ncbi:unnamed protein product [marine sediment metagenome]|uniref:Uncharacterized protein n=1 Tax=marine sediment metagenome TaxID=412755 RepID=X1JYT0_9ZZZZ
MEKMTADGLVERARTLVEELVEDGFTLIEIDLLAALMRKHITIITMAASIKKIMGEK